MQLGAQAVEGLDEDNDGDEDPWGDPSAAQASIDKHGEVAQFKITTKSPIEYDRLPDIKHKHVTPDGQSGYRQFQ